MINYYNTLIIMMVAAEICTLISPTDDSAKKIIRPMCGLFLLLTLLTPVSGLMKNPDKINFSDSISDSAGEMDEYSDDACAVLEYLSAEYGAEAEKIVFITTDAGDLDEIQLYLKPTVEFSAGVIKYNLEKEFGVNVMVFVSSNGTDG